MWEIGHWKPSEIKREQDDRVSKAVEEWPQVRLLRPEGSRQEALHDLPKEKLPCLRSQVRDVRPQGSLQVCVQKESQGIEAKDIEKNSSEDSEEDDSCKGDGMVGTIYAAGQFCNFTALTKGDEDDVKAKGDEFGHFL